jgi:hypothetical protein
MAMYAAPMEASNLLLAQALSLSGLVGATASYAGIVRRRRAVAAVAEAAAFASAAAVERVDRHRSLGRLEDTFIKSAYHRRDRPSEPRR